MEAGVTIRLQDMQGKEIAAFAANDTMSISQIAAKNGIEIPTSCCAGACYVCMAKIISWQELVHIDKLSIPLVDIETDANGQFTEVLTCIGGIKSSAFKDGKYHEIVLQKML